MTEDYTGGTPVGLPVHDHIPDQIPFHPDADGYYLRHKDIDMDAPGPVAVFSHDRYRPAGGMWDYIGSADTVEDAMTMAQQACFDNSIKDAAEIAQITADGLVWVAVMIATEHRVPDMGIKTLFRWRVPEQEGSDG